jgi:N-acyl-D-amino-acid deacylase
MDSTLLRSGRIVDGSGGPSFPGHVLIRGDRIAAILREGDATPETAHEVDATGCVIAPGFIDMHSHADWQLPLDDHPECLSVMLEQGVTTVVGGNCGVSPAPLRRETLGRLHDFASIARDGPFDYDWESFADYLEQMERGRPALNLAELVGHSTLRYAGSDSVRGTMPERELSKCLDRLRQSLEEGACGLSFGLGYDPGMYSSLEELEAFCEVAAEADVTATVHLKAYSSISPCYPLTTPEAHNVRALREMLEVARKTGVRLQLSHLIFVGRRSWPSAEKCLQMVDAARRDGLDIMIDAFPYTCGNTTIHAPFPYWFLEAIPGAYQSRLARMRLRVELELGFRLAGFIYSDFQVMDAGVEGWEELSGLTIAEIAHEWKTSPFDAMLKLAEQSRGAATMLFHSYSGEPENHHAMETVLRHEACLFETDVIVKRGGHPNPAALGTFPRILGPLVREHRLFDLETAVHRMTGASADRFGISDRGVLASGKAADVVVFDAERITDTPPVGKQPAGGPLGIEHVFINGEHAVKAGAYQSGVRAGQVIRP